MRSFLVAAYSLVNVGFTSCQCDLCVHYRRRITTKEFEVFAKVDDIGMLRLIDHGDGSVASREVLMTD
ncbi:hypothetical protein AB6A40_008020 [Gnathostoma spinigerum]|uniref:Uncharacterized protein n=1 Tax=Gnathostoma spinigerum TaxID=75299 RepID=A0ABD6EV23_9BILA